MDAYDSVIASDVVATIAMTLGLGWASGINLYAAILMFGLGGATGYVDLPPGLELLQSPLVIAAAGLMYCVEFFADKVPGVDSTWDGLHTFIRLPAGALLAAAAVGDVGPAAELAAALVGGSLAATSHATKAGSRLLINTSPEPFSNWTASVAEDISVVGGLWLALNHPILFLCCLLAFVALAVYLLPKIMRLIVRALRAIGRLLGLVKDISEQPEAESFASNGEAQSNSALAGEYKSQPSSLSGGATVASNRSCLADQTIDRLERLQVLRERGALNAEEFNREKAKLIGPDVQP